MSSGKRIFLVDDHPMVRAGLAQLLQSAGYAVVGQAGSKKEILAHIRTSSGDMILLDLALDGDNGLELIPILKSQGLKVLIYTMHDEPYTVAQAFTAGASGFVTKRETAQSLLVGVAAVLRGETYLSPRASIALSMPTPIIGLTGQQLRIYQLLGQGLGNDEIAQQLDISVRTLESYCARIIDKLGVAGMRELRQNAINSNNNLRLT